MVKCVDIRDKKKIYAAKISKNVEEEVENATVEVRLLQKLREPDPEDNEGHDCVLHILDHFMFDNRVIILAPALGLNLYLYQQQKFARSKSRRLFSKRQMRTIAKQMCQGLKFMKRKGVIHCDLKPENILFTDGKCRSIALIDFGAGCESYENGFTYVQSRYYRAPETVLGIPYDHQIDMWSAGCVLYELATGTVLFPGHDENEMLEYWLITIGKMPDNMIQASDPAKYKNFYTKKGNELLIKRSEKTRLGRGKLVPASQTVDDLMRPLKGDPKLTDFIKQCLILDPRDRLTAEAALEHPYVVGA